MISQFYLASIHPECAGSVGNALRECMGTRSKLTRVDPGKRFSFVDSPSKPVSLFIDLEGLSLEDTQNALETARKNGVVPVLLVERLEMIPEGLVEEYKIWSCVETRPEGRFRRAIQSLALDLINFHLLSEVENALRDGYHRTTRL